MDQTDIEKRLSALEQLAGGLHYVSKTDIIAGAVSPNSLSADAVSLNGDMYYSNGSNFVRLPAGATNAVLRIASGVPSWYVSGYSGTIATAKLTAGGANGSITVVNGLITAVVAAT